ncbi:hypothetical protein [Allohahella marinimesophila]|uniref:Uncharacterized protein n=1 Tax=Allohahella marinimesophila TaxID=1054972 RepID=A0ABP7NQZ2_9GAMM
MSQPPASVAAQLLERHVAHELEHFESSSLLEWFKGESNGLMQWLRQRRLEEIVTAQQVKDIIQRNVVDREISGAGVEIGGEAATHLFTSEAHRQTQLKQIMSTSQFAGFAEKVLELREQRMKGINHIIDLPIYKELISGVIYKAISRYIADTSMMNVRGVSSMLKMGRGVMNRTMPNLESAVEENIKKFINRNIGFLLRESKTFFEESFTDEDLRESAMDLWDIAENKTLGEIQEGMDSIDLSEFVALGYEFWLNFRTTPYFRDSYEMMVDYVFAKYGEGDLGLLFDDFDVTSERIVTELEPILPSLMTALKESGQLEAIVRRRLASFYQSPAALEILSTAPPKKKKQSK